MNHQAPSYPFYSQIWSPLTPSWTLSPHATVDPGSVQPKMCTIWGALSEKKDYKVTNTKLSAKTNIYKEKAMAINYIFKI